MDSAGNDHEYTLTRRIEVPRTEVFRAWVDATLLAQWWGPHANLNPECEIDARPGGPLRILMQDPAGTAYPLGGQIQDLVEPEHLVLALDLSGYPPAWHETVNPGNPDRTGGLRVTATFGECGDATDLVVRVGFASPAQREAHLRADLARGWEEGLDSLAALLRPILTSTPHPS